ncbi:MAG: YdcF family protein [Lactobacillaceae bacterium]|jgi:vancomycin permeability regulator SanA|nr:YdcF family protein [Lactobacillaceae bacterium]
MRKSSEILQKIAMYIGIALIIGCAVFAIVMNMSINNALGLLLGFALLMVGRYYSVMPEWLQTATRVSIYMASIFTVVVLSFMIKYGIHNTVKYDEDAAVILGSGIIGEEPAPMLALRLDAAAEYLEKNQNAIVLVAGGQGYGENITEALAMKRYLVAKGIDGGRIIEEDKSRNTYENLANAKEILDNRFKDKGYKIALITTDFHTFRSLKIAKKLGLNAASYNAPLLWYLRPGSTLRELISIVKYWSGAFLRISGICKNKKCKLFH